MRAALLVHTLMISSLVACGGGGNGKSSSIDGGLQPVSTSQYHGIWTSAVNGESYEITGSSVRILQHTSRHCLIADTFEGLDDADLRTTFALSSNGQMLSIRDSDGTSDLQGPTVRYAKSDALPPACSQPIATIGDSGYQRDIVRDLDLFGQTFSDYYLSFDLKQVDWPASLEAAMNSVGQATSDAEFFEVLYQLTKPLADAHVQVSSEQLGSFSADGKPTLIARLINEYAQAHALAEPLSPGDVAKINGYIGEQLSLREDILFSYAEDGTVKTAANGEISWYSVDNIAYLYIGAMTGFSDEDNASSELSALDAALDQVLTDIQSAEGLIIDIRTNNGGRDFLGMAIASRFVSTQTPGFSKQTREGNHRTELEEVFIEPRGDIQYLGPIALLTSNSTVSAAEVFTLMMRALPNVTVVGESTQGALSDALQKVLPNGFTFSLSNQFYFSPEGEWFEHTGIPADIEVPLFTLEEREAEMDRGIETAFALLKGQH